MPGAGVADIRGVHLYADLTTPFVQGGGSEVRVDNAINQLHLKLGVERVLRWKREGGPTHDRETHYGVELGGDAGSFSYYPQGGDASTQERHLSVDAVAFYMRRSADSAGRLYAPQVSLRYVRQYQDASAVGIVEPVGGGNPPLVIRTVPITPPTASPGLLGRFAIPMILLADAPVGLGPSIAYALSGNNRDWKPFQAAGRLQGELWIYYWPAWSPAFGATNVRFGATPFISVRTHGEDGQDRVVYGGLAELRLNKDILKY